MEAADVSASELALIGTFDLLPSVMHILRSLDSVSSGQELLDAVGAFNRKIDECKATVSSLSGLEASTVQQYERFEYLDQNLQRRRDALQLFESRIESYLDSEQARTSSMDAS